MNILVYISILYLSVLSTLANKIIMDRVTNAEEYFAYDEDMSSCAAAVAENFFYRWQYIPIITAYGDNKDRRCEYSDISIFQELTNYMVDYLTEFSSLSIICDVQKKPVACENFIIITENVRSFEDNLDLIPSDYFNYGGRIIIILKSNLNSKSEKLKNIQNIINKCWNLKMVNVVVIANVEGYTAIYTFFPYSEHGCGNSKAIEFNKWKNKSFETNMDLYPLKTLQMHGCPVRVTTIARYPHVITKHLVNGTIVLEGVEGNLVRVLGELLNYTLIVREPMNEYVWGRWNGKEWTGASGDLVYNRADIAIGAYYPSLMRFGVLDLSYGYDSIEIVWTIPRLKRDSSASKLLLPFTLVVWISIFVTIILLVFVLLYLRMKIKNRTVQAKELILSLWQVTLGLSIKYTLMGRFVCYAFVIWMWTSMVLRNIYQGSLVGFLTHIRYDDSIKNMYDLLERNFTFFGTNQVVDIMKNVTDNPAVTEIFKRLNVIETEIEYDNISELVATGQVFGAMPHLKPRVPELNSRFGGKGVLVIIEETYRTQIVTMAFVKFAPMLDAVNYYIHRISEAGLIDKWLEDLQPHAVDLTEGPIIIKMHHVLGPFFILFVGELLAILVFIIELIYHKSIVQKTQTSITGYFFE